MENLNQSLTEGVCIDEEVFFGPITDKERKVREQFENLHRNELKGIESSKTIEDDESPNYSAYKSFSADESKYDSFDDSLNEEIDKMPQEAKPIPLRKSYDKVKSKRSGFYDSLEDVCSLASNIDKCSISCEVENESHLNSKHFVEDSLKVPEMQVPNKNFINDQVHFDDDSLAIIECEATFSDSLEEVNVLESIEIEDINNVENMTVENQNFLLTVSQNSACSPKNLFDTSVEIVCEKKILSDITDQEGSSDDKNLLYDSLSNSDFKDILTDSLEEGNKLLSLLNHVTTKVNSDQENAIDSQNIVIHIDQDSVHTSTNLFDTSVQIVFDKHKGDIASPKELLKSKNTLWDSFSNSEVKDSLKDSLEESDKSNENLDILHPKPSVSASRSEDSKQNSLETSVQIIYDNLQDCFEKQGIYEENDVIQDDFEKRESLQKTSVEETMIETDKGQPSTSKNTSENYKNIPTDKSMLVVNSCANEDNKMTSDISAITEPTTAVSANAVTNIEKETFTVESCHLNILNDDINIDKDEKFQVTVGDKTCQISPQDIKIVPVIGQEHKSELDSVSTPSVAKSLNDPISTTTSCIDVKQNEPVINLMQSELDLENKDCGVFRTHSPNEANLSSRKKSEMEFLPNITHRKKSSVSQTCSKLNCVDSFNNVSLLQALDLPDLSASFLNESIIQSKDSLMPLNLYSPDEYIQNFHASQFKNKNKENIPEHIRFFENENFCAKRKSPNKVFDPKSPQGLQKSSSFKETNKKALGTKIPVRKVENFAVPAFTPKKLAKPVSATQSAEKVKKVQHSPHSAEKVKKCQHSPHSVDSGKKTSKTTPHRIPHICKVRNTIFSKVPQIVTPKKYMNIQSPVAQYIKNSNGCVKTPGNDLVLRDCMNHLKVSPHHSHHTCTGESLKSAKK